MKFLQKLLVVAGIFIANPAFATQTVTYFHNDVSGSPMVATDSNGALVWKENYTPYGNRLDNQAASSNNDIWFSGKPYDQNTGLSYFGARYYDPVLGRFMAVDPKETDASDPLSFGRYTYSNDNPYKFGDCDGREPAFVTGFRYGVAAGVFNIPGAARTINETPGWAFQIGAFIGVVGGPVLLVGAPELAPAASSAGAGVGSLPQLPKPTAPASPVAGGGASVGNMSAQDIARVQNAANRTGTEISVVGSRAGGKPPGPSSDWDYVVPDGTSNRTIHSLKSSLPEGPRGLGEPRNQDFHQGAVDPKKPHITFTPTATSE